jgi:hypothetical protein
LETDVENAATCPYEGEREVRSLYLSGKLTEKEAQAFEEHFFACARCAEAVEVGATLRSAFENAPVRPAATPARATRTWLPLAAAAVVALGAVGVWQIARRPPPAQAPVLRSRAEALVVKVEAGESSLGVSWTRNPAATGYVVQVFKPDGESVWRTETREPRIGIERSALPSREGLAMQVEAIDAMGRVVATSELVPVPAS